MEVRMSVKSLVLRACVLIILGILIVYCSRGIYRIEYNDYETDDVLDYSINISNNQDLIEPKVFFNSSYSPVFYDGEIRYQFADGLGMYGFDMVENIDNIPAIQQTTQMTLIINDTTSCFNINIYDSEAILVDSLDSWKKQSNLKEGQYFIVLSIKNEINNFYEYVDCLFVLYVN